MTFDRSGVEQQFEIAVSVIEGLRGLDFPVNLKGLARLTAMAHRGQTAGVPINELNRVIDEVNAIAAEGRMIGGCEW